MSNSRKKSTAPAKGPARKAPVPRGAGFAFAPPETAESPPESLIGWRIKALRKELGLTQIDFAEKLGATQSAVSKWERRDETPSDVYVDRIAQLTNTTAGFIRYGDAYQRRHVPILGYVGAGGQIFDLEDDPKPTALDGLNVPSLMPYDAVAVLVRGDVLFPEIDDGTALVYRRDAPFDEAACLGKRCIVQIEDGPLMVKRVVSGAGPGRFTLIATSARPLSDVELAWATPILAYIPT